MGKQRKDALKDLGIRTGVEELNAFISAVIQADQLGVSIGNVLRCSLCSSVTPGAKN